MVRQEIVLGGGCFWCTEAVFQLFNGIESVVPGYSGGKILKPNYTLVSTGLTGYAEVIDVVFDDSIISFQQILTIFFASHDPTSRNKQGHDIGTQYRSVIFYTTEEQRKEAESFIKKIQKDYQKPIVTEVKKLEKFYKAEDYHINYFKNNPEKGYCQLVISPKVEKVKVMFQDLLKVH